MLLLTMPLAPSHLMRNASNWSADVTTASSACADATIPSICSSTSAMITFSMDLSKLPRLSKSNTPPPAQTPAQEAQAPKGESPRTAPCPFCGHPLRIGARFCDSCGAQLVRKPGRGSAIPEAFIGIAIAVILLIIYPHFIEYLLHPHDTSAFD